MGEKFFEGLDSLLKYTLFKGRPSLSNPASFPKPNELISCVQQYPLSSTYNPILSGAGQQIGTKWPLPEESQLVCIQFLHEIEHFVVRELEDLQRRQVLAATTNE